jgi:hypothetical protein
MFNSATGCCDLRCYFLLMDVNEWNPVDEFIVEVTCMYTQNIKRRFVCMLRNTRSKLMRIIYRLRL